MSDNVSKVQEAFRVLQKQMAGYVWQEMRNEYKDGWWREALSKLAGNGTRLPEKGSDAELAGSLDVANCLRLFEREWNELFKRKLSPDYRTWARELMGVRNRTAHAGGADFGDDDTWRALDTMARLCEAFDASAAEEIRAMLREARYGSAKGTAGMTNAGGAEKTKRDTAKDGENAESNPYGLPSWRDVIEPHPDVAQGRYKKAEFAADLAQVARGEGAFEYRDPVEFFARTYITEGMSGLLTQSLKRIAGNDGEPVVQLKTAFGGGKTHSMLALYHIMRGAAPLDKIPSLKPLLERAGLSALPKANVAVIVGTALDPTKPRRPQNLPGVTVNTLWGETAAQLAISAGKPEVYSYVKNADKKGVSPGSEALKNLFDACSPCMVLMDELVAYAKKLYGASELPAGSFDNFITFIQEITEAAKASENALVVASIPESAIEIGGEAGKRALDAIEHTFGRMEAVWKPVAANEGFEVVRRRLFLDCKNPSERDRVCAAFGRMYVNNENDFPVEAREAEYVKRMAACYPIHPEVFDRLYEDWATLERFQRTRGVLRLMAAVIHELWMGNDADAMITPGSIPLDVPNVRDELTRHLNDGWNAIVDREVDGKKSVPYQKDRDNARYGKQKASRRVARTIMLGSAPTGRGQAVRGIEVSRVRLGVMQPGENISVYNDALNALQSSLAYLYSSGNRYYYDTRPTLRKTAADRAAQQSAADVVYETERRLKAMGKEPPFAGVHACPGSSLDVPDEQAARLVLLRPEYSRKSGDAPQNDAAVSEAEEILNFRGQAPRVYRNTLAFVAADSDAKASLEQAVRQYLAWKSIREDAEELNLDAHQNKETANNVKRSDDDVKRQINEAYCWLLVPYIDKDSDIKTVKWDVDSVRGGDRSVVQKAAAKMTQNDALVTEWAPALLRKELDSVLWRERDSISIKELWEFLCSYCYLPRLSRYEVLEETVRLGLNSKEYFAVADWKDGERFVNLKYGEYVGKFDKSALLVKPSVAEKQIKEQNEKEREKQNEEKKEEKGGQSSQADDGAEEKRRAQPKKTRFFLSAKLDNTRINRDVQRLVEEIVSHLTGVDGSRVDVRLEVDASAPGGVPQATVRTVTENCQALRVESFGFDE